VVWPVFLSVLDGGRTLSEILLHSCTSSAVNARNSIRNRCFGSFLIGLDAGAFSEEEIPIAVCHHELPELLEIRKSGSGRCAEEGGVVMWSISIHHSPMSPALASLFFNVAVWLVHPYHSAPTPSLGNDGTEPGRHQPRLADSSGLLTRVRWIGFVVELHPPRRNASCRIARRTPLRLCSTSTCPCV